MGPVSVTTGRRGFLAGGVLLLAAAIRGSLVAAAPGRTRIARRKAAALVLALHPANPRYFLWRGKPTILVGSGEHYGAVLNRRFDYVKYLDTLRRYGLNHTRLFNGLYVEDNGLLRDGPQAGNTLDPAPGQLLCPFARSDAPATPRVATSSTSIDGRKRISPA